MTTFTDKEIIVFDLDGTLAESKQPLDREMASLLAKLLAQKKVAVISGGSLPQFKKQFLPPLEKEKAAANLRNLYLLPTSGSALYSFQKNDWIQEYSHDLTREEKALVRDAFPKAMAKAHEDMPAKFYGDIIEDRGSQMTFSALGQDAPIRAKAQWDPTEKRRLAIAAQLSPLLPGFSIGIGGMTSIDVTRKGIDKAFGIRELSKFANIPIEKMLYVGDALFPGGNDYPARASGIECQEVAGVTDAKRLIEAILN